VIVVLLVIKIDSSLEKRRQEFDAKWRKAEADSGADLDKLKLEEAELKKDEEEMAKKEAELKKKEKVSHLDKDDLEFTRWPI
jgi:hypothetical protein